MAKLRGYLLTWFCLLGVLYGPSIARCNEVLESDPIHKLLKQRIRPTIEQFTMAMNQKYGETSWPKTNPFREQDPISIRDAAKIIAAMERAFPGGTFLGLGRDVAMLGDLADAFYRSINQPDRVRRLDASGPSFPHYYNASNATFRDDMNLLAGFLQTNGLNFESVEKTPPFIIFDVTSWRPTSQSRQLIRAAYQKYATLGGDLKLLYDRVNFLGISMGHYTNEISPQLDVEEFKKKERAEISENGPENPLYLPSRASSFSYTEGWHEMFRSFARSEDGRVITSPGENIANSHLSILSELFEIMEVVNNPEFVETVKRASRELGYEFPLMRTESLAMLPKAEIPRPDIFKVDQLSWKHDFKPPKDIIDMSIYMSTAKDRLKRSLDPISTGSALFEDLAGMATRGTASKANFKKLINIFRKKSLLENEQFMESLVKLSNSYPEARSFLVELLKPAEYNHFHTISMKLINLQICAFKLWNSSKGD